MSDTETPSTSEHDLSTEGAYVTPGSDFLRDTDYVTTRVTRDGRDGYPVESGRYRLIAARACPWANRAIIVRRLLGLEDAISMGLTGPTHDKRSWTYDLDPGGVDPVLGYERLQQAYFARFPDYPRGITVPAFVDVTTKQLVTNNCSQKSYDRAYDRLFTALDWLTERLTYQRYLVGDTITEADVRLFTTLARFDPV